jgi:hydrogenase nickel incorporation protein HypA/HybF
MHEVSLVQALFDQADRAIEPHASSAVRRVTVRIGVLAGVESELFRTAFEACKAERGYLEAALDVIDEEAVWDCAACGEPLVQGDRLRCASCGGGARLVAGGALILQRVELEVRDV